MRARHPALRWLGLAAAVPLVYAGSVLGTDGPAGGAATVRMATSHAFSQPVPGLSDAEADRHRRGDILFDASFVTAPAPRFAGLGPTFNAVGCGSCHARDGRTAGVSVVRVSVPGVGPRGGPLPAPGLGLQVQDRAIFGETAEAAVETAVSERIERLADGTEVVLRVPTVSLTGPRRPSDLLLSARAARPVFGLGLLEAVPDAALYDLAERQAEAGEVSGRVQVVWDPVEQRERVGRFGHKAGEASLLSQTVRAFHDDVGITTTTTASGPPELGDADLDDVVFYLRTLAVPDRRRRDDPEVQRGQSLFASVGCAACHVPSLQTGPSEIADLDRQTIYPYTDLLLHDMGDGLADGRPEFEASGREWRTPPLWGLGLTRVVNGEPGFLHDGRARTVTEAVLWHGGEAAGARERFRRLPAEDRDALLAFLRSL